MTPEEKAERFCKNYVFTYTILPYNETKRKSGALIAKESYLAGYHECEKEHEWHYVKDGDLPEVDNKIVLCVCGNGYIDGKRNYKLKLLTRKEFPLFQPVYAWKEIVLPKESE